MVVLTVLNILRTARAISMNFWIAYTPRCHILIWDAKYFASFSRFLPVKSSKKWTALRKQIPSPLPNPVLTRLSYSSVIRVKIFVLKHQIFFDNISNFNKWKSLIIDKKSWMLRNAMLSKENDNFATKVISTENIEKIDEDVRRKNQTYSFSKLLGDLFKSYFLWKNIRF